MKIDVKKMPEMRVGAVRHVGPYEEIPEAFERLGETGGPAGVFGKPGAAVLAIYYDDPITTKANQLRSDAAIVVPETLPLPDGLAEQRLPAGRYASTVHIGPYSGLGETWRRLTEQELPAAGYRMTGGASYEIYLNMPGEVPDEKLRTELYVPVE